MSNRGIMKDWRSHCRQVFHYAYSSYIQASNQAIKGQKPLTKAQKSPKAKKKNYTKIENFKKLHKNKHRKGYMTSPPP